MSALSRNLFRLKKLTEFRRTGAGKAIIAGMKAETEAAKARAALANPQRGPGVQ